MKTKETKNKKTKIEKKQIFTEKSKLRKKQKKELIKKLKKKEKRKNSYKKAHPEKKSSLAKKTRQTEWAPVWVVLKKYGVGKKIHPSETTHNRRSWRRTKLKVLPRKLRKSHYG